MTAILEPVDQHVAGPPWVRSAGELVGVDFPGRTIELIVIPYEREADVPHPTKPNAGLVTEVISRGAFDGIQRRANRIRANRDHRGLLTFGRAMRFHPGDEHGLRAEIRVARTPLGDETLALADDGCLDASAGFWPMRNGLQWEGPTSYRITRGFLHHIALVDDGAYGEDAAVLSVRQAQPAAPGERRAMPTLQAVENEIWAQKLADIDARYRH
jgi:HK97 family phage prohead protease